MKKTTVLVATVAAFAIVLTSMRAMAEDKEVTITGKGECAKCALKETDHCQNAIVTGKGDEKKTYYLVQNDVSKKFHENICKESKEVTATGTVKEVDGKMELTATKIELAKKE